MVMRSRHDDDDETRDGYLDVVPPGGSVRVPAYLMDQRKFFDFNNFNRDHQPHFAAPLNDAAQHNKAAARLEWLANLRDAWKTCGRIVANKDADPDEPDPDAANVVERQRRDVTAEDLETARRKIRGEFSRRLSEAWRGGR